MRADRLYACGGGARSEGWLQIKTDILGIPICSLGDVQAGTMGCVMMAGVAGGIYRDLQEAAACCVKEGKWFEPCRDRQQAYQELYGKYTRLYQAVKEVLA